MTSRAGTFWPKARAHPLHRVRPEFAIVEMQIGDDDLRRVGKAFTFSTASAPEAAAATSQPQRSSNCTIASLTEGSFSISRIFAPPMRVA